MGSDVEPTTDATQLSLSDGLGETERAAAVVAAAAAATPQTDDTSFWPKGSPKNTEISLGGVKVKVRTDATPASLRQIRELVEEKFTEFADKLEKGVSTHQLTVLVAFNMAEELLKERERNRVLKKKTVEWAERLMDRVESHLSNNS